jgi:hypothetical protein
MTKPGDIDHFTRVRCYEHVLAEYPEQTTTLSLLNLAMRMAGPREALWHAIVRKNYGCTHFIVGRDHAGPGNDRNGEPFYGPYEAQELYREYEEELGIAMVPFKEMVYVENKAEYLAADETEPGDQVVTLSGAEFRRRLREGLEIPEWFSFPASGRGTAPRAPAQARAGLHGVLHRPVGLRQVDHRQRADDQAAGSRRPPGHPAGRRHRAQEPVQRADLFQGAPRPEHPAHRLRRRRDHQEPRHRHLRADRALHPHAPRWCGR